MSAIAPALESPRSATHPAGVLAKPGLSYLVAFAAAAVGAGLGRAITTTYLPVLLNHVREAPGLIGTVMLVNAAAGFAVPLAVGLWSDRLGRRLVFILGGSVVTAGGLAAMALGSGSSYAVLTLAGAVVYVGLNAVTTAHRALVPESFAPGRRARATSAQELAMLVGGIAGIVLGGSLVEAAAWVPFAVAALAVPLLAVPTLARVREPRIAVSREHQQRPAGYYARAVARPGVLAFLVAQVLWVLGYAGMPVFFVLYAERVLGLEPGAASLWLAGFGVATGAAMLAAGRVRDPARHKPLLALGVALMGVGFLGVSLTTSLAAVGAALLAAAAGFGLISTLGFPLFSALIPPGEEGGYTALYFSVRSISSALALPAAGWAIAATGSYRMLFVLGGAVTLTALVPLLRVQRKAASRSGLRPPARGALLRAGASLAALYALTLALGLADAATGLHGLDEAVFRAVNALGPGPRLLFELLEDPIRNYLLLGAVAVGAALLTRRRPARGMLALTVASAGVAFGLLEAIYAVYDRPRPSEVFDRSTIVLGYGHNWARIESFPSGHMALVTALAVATWLALPRLRLPLVAFVGLHAVARVLFGAHFPLDVIAGIALGYASARITYALVAQTGLLGRSPAAARAPVQGNCADCPQAA